MNHDTSVTCCFSQASSTGRVVRPCVNAPYPEWHAPVRQRACLFDRSSYGVCLECRQGRYSVPARRRGRAQDLPYRVEHCPTRKPCTASMGSVPSSWARTIASRSVSVSRVQACGADQTGGERSAVHSIQYCRSWQWPRGSLSPSGRLTTDHLSQPSPHHSCIRMQAPCSRRVTSSEQRGNPITALPTIHPRFTRPRI